MQTLSIGIYNSCLLLFTESRDGAVSCSQLNYLKVTFNSFLPRPFQSTMNSNPLFLSLYTVDWIYIVKWLYIKLTCWRCFLPRGVGRNSGQKSRPYLIRSSSAYQWILSETSSGGIHATLANISLCSKDSTETDLKSLFIRCCRRGFSV
jgi:hypothetical protein